MTIRPADTNPPTATEPAAPSTLAARSEPERRAEPLGYVLTDGEYVTYQKGMGREDTERVAPLWGPRWRLCALVPIEPARAEERSHEDGGAQP